MFKQYQDEISSIFHQLIRMGFSDPEIVLLSLRLETCLMRKKSLDFARNWMNNKKFWAVSNIKSFLKEIVRDPSTTLS